MLLEPDIPAAAALFSDASRAAMLTALLDRTLLSAGQLAIAANISPQNASFHLAKLTKAALLVSERQGRTRAYRLAGPAVAGALESLAAISTARPVGSEVSSRMSQLRAARSCYDHLAGVAGVALHDAIVKLGYLSPDGSREYHLTSKGHEWVAAIGGDSARTRSSFARGCLDWTERRPHLAGRLAAHLLECFFKDGWIARIPGTRAVRITQHGLREFERQYGLNLTPVAASCARVGSMV